MNNICVIIPQYGKEEYTKKCILLTQENAGVPVDILVVDDGSKEPFAKSVDPMFGVEVLTLKENTGFTNAMNQGILWAQRRGYEYIHMLNNDTEPHEDFIKVLLEEMKDPEVGIASSARLHNIDGKEIVELWGTDLLRGFQAVINKDKMELRSYECNWVPTCSSLIRMDMIRYLGLLDKRMRTHSSDLDYCLRARLNGYKIVVNTNSIVFHYHAVTTNEHKISPEKDQKMLLEKLAGIGYAQLLNVLPLDHENKTYGKLSFTVYNK